MKTGERPATITTARAKVSLSRDEVIADLMQRINLPRGRQVTD